MSPCHRGEFALHGDHCFKVRHDDVCICTERTSLLGATSGADHDFVQITLETMKAESASSRCTRRTYAKISDTVLPAPCSSNRHRPKLAGIVMHATFTHWWASRTPLSRTSGRSCVAA